MTCNHNETEYIASITRTGNRHVFKRCKQCLANVNGPGVWIAWDKCPVDPMTLPVVKDNRPPERKGEQPLLEL